MYLMYSTAVWFFFSISPKNTDAFALSWHMLKNSVAGELGLLHSHPFTNTSTCHYCGIGDLPRRASTAQKIGWNVC